MIVLDTHAWVWWVSEPWRLPDAARRLIDETVTSAAPVHLSSISVWEVAMLVQRGRLELTMDVETWVAHTDALPFVSFVPVDNRVALDAVRLDGFPHRDPADRIIVATAVFLGAALVTADERLRGYGRVDTVWD